MIDAQSSLKVSGWATSQFADWSMIDSERRAHEDYANEQAKRRTVAYDAFDTPDIAFGSGSESTEEHKRQVAKMINAMGESGAGRRHPPGHCIDAGDRG